MKTNKEEFNKAVKKKIFGNLGGTIACGFLTWMFIFAGYIFYAVEPDLATGFLLLGLLAGLGLLYNFVETLPIVSCSKKQLVGSYHLCKRCKNLIRKNKVFCSDCKNELRRSLKHNEDKQYLNKYQKIIKKEKKK